MNIFKNASVFAFLAAVLTGCGKPPVEAMCEAQDSCGLLSDDQTAQQCTMGATFAMGLIESDETCADMARKLEDEIRCTSELSCEDMKKAQAPGSGPLDTSVNIAPGTPCRAEKLALLEEVNSGKCKLFSHDSDEHQDFPAQDQDERQSSQAQRSCVGSDCDDGFLQFSCDSRFSSGQCFDFETETDHRALNKPVCHGTTSHRRCSPAGRVGTCITPQGKDGEKQLRYYQNIKTPSWTVTDAQQDCEKRLGVFRAD